MPVYTYALWVPAATPETDPVSVDAELPYFLRQPSVLHKIEIHFPEGCNGLVHVAIFYGIRQIFPQIEGMTFRGNAETVSFNEYYELPNDPTTLTIKAWSPETRYDHTIFVRFGVLPRWYFTGGKAMERLEKLLSSFLGIEGEEVME
jgi:hypothetical protein